MIKTTTLSNGLRIITDTVKAVDSVAIGVWADSGARDEELEKIGLAHLVEHMLFKGTSKRNALEIVNSIENVGGDVNAFTGREVTAYFIHLLKEDTELALDVLSDIVQNSAFPDDELVKEKEVVLQEISMVNDTPDDLIFDVFQETAYPGQTIGTPILGRSNIVKNMPKDELHSYVHRSYTPNRLVISAAGHIEHERLVSLCETYFGNLPPQHDFERGQPEYKGGYFGDERDLEQTHIMVGFRGTSRLSPDYYTSHALSSILGGGMSSRLFQEVREKRGLAYSVFSFQNSVSDDGIFGIYASTTPNHLNELVPVICDELENVAQNITSDEVERAKTQMRAELLMGREKMMRRANHQAKHMLYFNKAVDVDSIIADINAITKDDIGIFAQNLRKTDPTVCAIGPLSNLENYDRIKERLAA